MIKSKFERLSKDELPVVSHFRVESSNSHTRFDCFSICTKDASCGMLAVKKSSNGITCLLFKAELRCGPFETAPGYRLFVRNRDYN